MKKPQSLWVNGEAKKAIDSFPLPQSNYSERVKAIVNLANRYVEEKGIDVLFAERTPNGDYTNEESEKQE
jgi:hypothetical protein